MNLNEIDRENPFPGLRPFEPEEDYLFFGREAQIDDLLERLKKSRFLTVVGASGSGKSSLVRAGLLPALYGGYMLDRSSKWLVAMFRPGAHPIRALAEALADSKVLGNVDPDVGAYEAIMIESMLRRGSLGLVEVFEQLRGNENEKLLVVVDQFEELFRFKKQTKDTEFDDDAAAFVKLVLEASKSELSIYIVLTMRSDFLGDCSQFRDLPEAINDGQFLVPRMRRDQQQLAIEGPIAVGGATIENRLVQLLLNNIGDEPDQLPILQHALMRTWNRWEAENAPDKPIDLPHYEAIGGMAEALSKHGDEIYRALPDEHSRKIAEIIFKRLTDRSQDARGIRRPTRLRELVAVCQAPVEKVVAVIDAFRQEDRSLLMPPHDVDLREDTQIDISHESLMRVWKRLNEWVDEEAESAKTYKRLAETATLYERNQAGLWRDPDLQGALNWQEKAHPSREWAMRYHPGYERAIAFLEESKKGREEELRREARTKRLSFFLAIIGLIALIALVAFGYSFFQYQNAESARQDLQIQTQIAESSLEVAQQQKEIADSSLIAAQRQKEIADSSLIVAQRQKEIADSSLIVAQRQKEIADSSLIVAQRQRDIAADSAAAALASREEALRQKQLADSAQQMATLARIQSLGLSLSRNAIRLLNEGYTELGAVLAREAYVFDEQSGSYYINDIYDALSKSLEQLREEEKVQEENLASRFLVDHQGEVHAVAYSPDGNWIASASDNGIMYLFSPFEIQKPWVVEPSPITRSLVFSIDGSLLGSSTIDGKKQIWRISGNSSAREIDVPETLRDVATQSFDTHALSYPENEDLLAIRTQAALELISSNVQAGTITSVAYSPDGLTLVVGFEDGTLGIIAEADESSTYTILRSVHDGPIKAIAVSPDGEHLATAGNNAIIQLRSWYDVAAGPILLRGHIAPINDLAFNLQNSHLASASSDKTVRLWDLEKLQNAPIILAAHDDWVHTIAFAPDGTTLVSGSQDRTVRLWDVSAGRLADAICDAVSITLTEEQWTEYVGQDIDYDENYRPCQENEE